MNEFQIPVEGDHVIFVDQESYTRNALVTAVWGDGKGGNMPSVNLVVVHKDPDRKDAYGRQIDRTQTSVIHRSNQSAHGFFWRWPEE